MTNSPDTHATTLRIERATAEDAPLVMKMAREIAAHQNQLDGLTTTAQRWAELLERADVIVLIARDGTTTPVGYASAVRRLHLWAGKDIIALDDLYVREAARGHGVGESLMQHLAQNHAAAEKLTITWGMQPHNEGAIRFYHRLGAKLRTKVVADWTPSTERVKSVETSSVRRSV